MPTTVEAGKGNEFAVASVLAAKLGIGIRENSSKVVAEKSFYSLSGNTRNRFLKSAETSVSHVLTLENESLEKTPATEIVIMDDSAGKRGDVRDVVVKSNKDIFGLSCKSNHDAYKHPRLSARIDWVKKWGLDEAGCSNSYWESVRPLFLELNRIKQTSHGLALFRELDDLHGDFYEPILKAFDSELMRLNDSSSADLASNLIKYVVGSHDFYKVITGKNGTKLQRFNFNGTLSGSKTKPPTKIIGLDRIEGGEYSSTVRFDRGYVFNFRIHSASSRVEPSLKFDIRAIGLPESEIYTQHFS